MSGVAELTVVFFFFDTAFPWKRKKNIGILLNYL